MPLPKRPATGGLLTKFEIFEKSRLSLDRGKLLLEEDEKKDRPSLQAKPFALKDLLPGS
jgi:hypothetical protein